MIGTPFEELREGDVLVTRARTVTEADVCAFSALTWDHHPIHTDAEYARDALFGERVAHGMLVLSFALGLMPLDGRHLLALRRVGPATFRRPVRIGDTIHLEGRVAQTSPLEDGLGVVRLRFRVLTQDGQAAVTGELDALWSGAARPAEVVV